MPPQQCIYNKGSENRCKKDALQDKYLCEEHLKMGEVKMEKHENFTFSEPTFIPFAQSSSVSTNFQQMEPLVIRNFILNRELDNAKEQLIEKEKRIQNLEGQLKVYESKIDKLEKENFALEKNLKEAKEEIEKLRERIYYLEEELKSRNKEIDKLNRDVEELKKEKKERNILFTIGQIMFAIKRKFQQCYADKNQDETYFSIKIIRGRKENNYNYDKIPNLSEILESIFKEENQLRNEKRKRNNEEQKIYDSDLEIIREIFSEQNRAWVNDKSNKELLNCIQGLLKISKDRNEEAHSPKSIDKNHLQDFLKGTVKETWGDIFTFVMESKTIKNLPTL